MKRILNISFIISLAGFCLTLYIDNRNNGVDVSVLLILVLILSIYLVTSQGKYIDFVKVAVTIMGFTYTLVKTEVITSKQGVEFAGAIMTLLIVLLGIYVMLGSPGRKSDEVDFTFNKRTGRIKRKWF